MKASSPSKNFFPPFFCVLVGDKGLASLSSYFSVSIPSPQFSFHSALSFSSFLHFLCLYLEKDVVPSEARSDVSVLLREKLARAGCKNRNIGFEPNEGYFGGILLGIVDVIAVIPVTSRKFVALDGDRGRPSSAAACVIHV
jgi:hypothetical protein